MGIKQNSWKVCEYSPTIQLIFSFKVQKCTCYVCWKVFTVRGSMRETWTHDTDSVRLLLWITVDVDNMFILYLRIVSVYTVSKSLQNYENKFHPNQIFWKFSADWREKRKDLVDIDILCVWNLVEIFIKRIFAHKFEDKWKIM